MDEMTRLNEDIETLRDSMRREAEKLGISHKDIIHLSQKLDKLIYKYMLYKQNVKLTP